MAVPGRMVCCLWKGSVSDCLGHLHEKHMGSEYVAIKNIAKFFPPWTVTRDVWQMALHPDVSGIAVDAQLFHEAGCHLVHKYRVYKDPFPHLELRGGVLPRLLSLVGRAMAIAQLTQLRISIPASGASPGQVPEECFPGGTSSWELASPVVYRSPVTSRSWVVHHHKIIRRTLCCMIRLVRRLLKGMRWILVVQRRIFLPRQFSWPREEF